VESIFNTSIVCAQLGARRHYAVPRALNEMGSLNLLFTDIVSDMPPISLLSLIPNHLRPKALKALLGRRAYGIPKKKIRSSLALGLGYTRALRQAKTWEAMDEVHLKYASKFSQAVASQLPHNTKVVYGMNGQSLELAKRAEALGVRIVIDQKSAPRDIEEEIMETARGQFSKWICRDDNRLTTHALVSERQKAEWEYCDRIVCGSDFVKRTVARAGGPAEKCRVVPYGMDHAFQPLTRLRHNGPIRVLTIGTIGLQKGTPYIIEAARKLVGAATFKLVGNIACPKEALSNLPENVEILERVPRSEIIQQYLWADVFLLPSLCEGSAAVTYEALSTGLPLIVTDSAGSIVHDKVDGFIVPCFESGPIVEAIAKLHHAPELTDLMGRAAAGRLREMTLSSYGERLMSVISELA
jgi:glycosyltransferase involved in cell wall biosynthesis